MVEGDRKLESPFPSPNHDMEQPTSMGPSYVFLLKSHIKTKQHQHFCICW
jgi:hypothetical protein